MRGGDWPYAIWWAAGIPLAVAAALWFTRHQAPERADTPAPAPPPGGERRRPPAADDPRPGSAPGPERTTPTLPPVPGHHGPVTVSVNVHQCGCIWTWNPERKWRHNRDCRHDAFVAEWEPRLTQ